MKEKKEQGAMTEEQIQQQELERAQLQLLIGDAKAQKPELTKEERALDRRFKAGGDRDYAVDPTHREFKKVVLGHNKVVKRSKKY